MVLSDHKSKSTMCKLAQTRLEGHLFMLDKLVELEGTVREMQSHCNRYIRNESGLVDSFRRTGQHEFHIKFHEHVGFGRNGDILLGEPMDDDAEEEEEEEEEEQEEEEEEGEQPPQVARRVFNSRAYSDDVPDEEMGEIAQATLVQENVKQEDGDNQEEEASFDSVFDEREESSDEEGKGKNMELDIGDRCTIVGGTAVGKGGEVVKIIKIMKKMVQVKDLKGNIFKKHKKNVKLV